MKHFEIKGAVRQTGPKAVVKAFRKQGLVPCNLYGNGLGEHVLFTVSEKDLRGLLYTPFTHIVDIVLDNGKKYEAVLGELQFHPVTEACLHIDFIYVNEKNPVSVMVPIKVSGHAAGVKAGGRFVLYERKLKVSGLAKDLPDQIDIAIDALGIGQFITVGDIKTEGYSILVPKDKKLCTVRATRNASAATAATTEEAAE